MSDLASRKLSVKSKRFYALGFSMILAIAFVHFAAQIFFIQNENSSLVETAAEIAPPVERAVNEKSAAEYETRKMEVTTISEIVKPDIRRQPKISRQAEIAPARMPNKKKVSIESRAERLRRAEQILTGI